MLRLLPAWFLICEKGLRWMLCYLFPAASLVLGLRASFSVTFSCCFSCSRAQSELLCYLFPAASLVFGLRGGFSVTFSLLLLLFSGSERASLLPFPAASLVFGLRGGFSVTFSCCFFCFRAQSELLCYPPCLFLMKKGFETDSPSPSPMKNRLFKIYEMK